MLSIAWTKPAPDFLLTRDGGDPLGFRAYANRLARELCPGLTQATRSTRCFGLLSLGMKAISGFEGAERNERFLRFERLWVMAQVRRLGEEARFAGKRRAQQLIDSAAETGQVDLGKPILTAQLSAGLWGTYRRTATLFGLIEARDRGGPRFAGLKSPGSELAGTIGGAVAPGFQFKTHLNKILVPLKLLDSIDPQGTGDQPDQAEVDLLTVQMQRFDRMHDHALANLRRCFDENDEALSLDDLDPHLLSQKQRAAHQAALELAQLLRSIEDPYRAWITNHAQRVRIDDRIWKDDTAWHQARVRGEQEVIGLRESVRRDPRHVMDQVHHHQEWLAGVRGAVPWRRGDQDPTKAAFEMPDFGLSAPACLFAEGVRPHA